MCHGKANNKYNDTLNAKAEFFFIKSKIMYNKAQCLRLICRPMWRYPDIHRDYNNKHRINIVYLITDWKNKVKFNLYCLNARADFLFAKYYK